MMVEVLTDDNFGAKLTATALPVLVDFFADWCGSCKMMAPVFEKLAGEYNGKMQFFKIDVDAAPNTAQMHAVQSIPTLVLFKGGHEVDRFVGFVDEHTLKMKIDAALR